MPTGVPDSVDLVEIRLGTRTQPIHERVQRLCLGSIPCLEFAQLCLGAAEHELCERRSMNAQPRTKRLEGGGECWRLGDRMSRVRRRHPASVAPYSTRTELVGTSPRGGPQRRRR